MDSGAVAFIDILGFKGIWQRMDHLNILDILKGVKEQVLEKSKVPPPQQIWPIFSKPEVTLLSDTIVITIKSEEKNCIFPMAHVVYHLIHYFFSYGLFVRGAIGYGNYVQQESTFIGPVIDDVAEWYEAADWIGTVLTPKTNYLYDRFINVEGKSNGIPVIPYIKYLVPGHNGKKFNLNCLNWPAYLQTSFSKIPTPEEKSEARIILEKMFSEQAEFGDSVLLKYENTLKFVDYSISIMNNNKT